MKVLAIITLAQPLSRSGSDRWGQFLRLQGAKEHVWLGRPLTPEEFNVEFPKALKFAGADRPLVGRILVEPEGAGEDVLPSILVSEHEARVAEIQEGVNDWAAEQNAKLEAAAARIDELEQLLLASKPEPAQTGDSAEKQSEDKISADADGPVPVSEAEGRDPVPAGVQVPDQPPASEAPEPAPASDLPPPEPEVKLAKSAPAKKAKGGK